MRYPIALVLAAALVAGCTDEPTQRAASDPGRATPDTPAATAATSAASPSPVATQVRAVYWLGASDSPRGPRLYREFFRRPAATDAVRDAVEAMLSLEPRDPDYASLWADGTSLRDVRREGSTAVVDLSREAAQNGGGSAFEQLTLQQLVHTATAADPGVRAVRLLVEGKPVETLWGSADASRPVSRGKSFEVLAPVWLDVEEGATIDGSFGGTATVFEATVSWQLRHGDRVADEGFSTAGIGAPGRGEWTGETDAPPGRYVLWAFESSAEDGSITWLDTKSVTLR